MVAGVHVTWPVTATGPAGQILTVKVASRRHRSALSLVSVDRNGKPVRALARKTVGTGTFTARLGAPGAYALRLVVAGRRYWSWITVSGSSSFCPPGGPPVVADCDVHFPRRFASAQFEVVP